MSFLKKIFGQTDPLAPLRKALDQRRWADAVAVGQALDCNTFDAEASEELNRLLDAAGDGLARLNLVEGEGCLRGGDRERAAEHFTLAAAQVRSDQLARQILQALQKLETSEAQGSVPSLIAASSCSSECCDKGGAVQTDDRGSSDHLDEWTRLELVLSSYPPEMASACMESGETFRMAFLLAHEGHEKEAAELFERIPEEGRNDLYHFEFGAVLGRLGELERACHELETALAINSGHTLALETLIELEIAGGKETVARERLENALARGEGAAFCHGALASLSARLGDSEKALQHGLQAVATGNSEPRILLLTASLLEEFGRPEESEAILMRIPGGGGCSGGASIPLAEFWLRQGKNLDKALETFKGALRQGSDHSRWAMRIAQTYIAKGWKKEGLRLLKNALADRDLEPDLATEGSKLLKDLES